MIQSISMRKLILETQRNIFKRKGYLMEVVRESKVRPLCTICGEEMNLGIISRKPTKYGFTHNGIKYEVYEYVCPACSTKTFVSEKFLNDFKKD